jgi:DnaJ-class molecular chaperone
LQVDANCTNDAIKKAYRKLALQHHPDITQNNPLQTQRFNEIKEAYEVLNNPEARKNFMRKYISIRLNLLYTIYMT